MVMGKSVPVGCVDLTHHFDGLKLNLGLSSTVGSPNAAGSSQSPCAVDEASRRIIYESKGSSRRIKLSVLILDRKPKSVSGSTTINLKISKAMRVDVTQDNLGPKLSAKAGPSTSPSVSVDSPDAISGSLSPVLHLTARSQ
ncbi:hypothetical protein K1719_027747 [Acacia pycnantha]|nr:hypothetical protein K1719_027747 [Acacia pycnantha]